MEGAIGNPAAYVQQPKRGSLIMLSASDDTMMLKQIQATHSPDGREINVKPLLLIVEDIFKQSTPAIDAIVSPAQSEALEDKTYQATVASMLEALSFLIDRIASEITYRCTGGGEAHEAAISILKMVSNYWWDAKLVIALSSFAMNYGEFWLLAQSYTSNQLAKQLATLRQLPEILQHTNILQSRFEAIKTLIISMLDIARSIVEFKELPSQYITADHHALSTAMTHIPLAVYWTIRCMLACASQIISLTELGSEHFLSTAESWEFSTLTHKLSNLNSHLASLLATCYKDIDEKKYIEEYQNLVHLLETRTHIDNMKVLKALINPKDDPQPLVDGFTKRRVHIEVLRQKNVLLLVSDLDILQDEVSILEHIYSEARSQPARLESQYELVWLPIVDPSVPLIESRQKQFENLQASMTWYTLHHPSLLDRAVIKFVKEEWKFQKKPILVVLDPQGRVACPDALHMMRIWGSLAFPFTTAREEALWNGETWRLELLVDNIDQQIMNWMDEGRFICLYGGEDIEWIRKFTTTANTVARAAAVPLALVYVGKSNPKERVKSNMLTIVAEKLSHYLPDLTSIWWFWIRIESMCYSKNQLGKTVENDPIMREIMTLLTFDATGGGWALISRGTAEMTRAKGSIFLTCLSEYNQWKGDVQPKGFVKAIHEYLLRIHTPQHCNRLLLPTTVGKIPERIVCTDCGRPMERYILYQCCDE
ncbi:hypothetical protein SLEP1_g45221 [Rubroshorea leprosula]|uniref:Protein SIEVE ELEMENT OCCLUSION B-like n=1 Tax=Rubroshorea leprosula TaxID=152421 RepID=A0AAV5LKK4_9ROSI|nr:hypothetical protein SLEP1_g45221 [Rubroshorea leprosula]